MYLIHSVASSALWPLAKSQSINLAASLAVMLCSILSTSCLVYLPGAFPFAVIIVYHNNVYLSSILRIFLVI